jgi:hypothetical protein
LFDGTGRHSFRKGLRRLLLDEHANDEVVQFAGVDEGNRGYRRAIAAGQ